MKKKLLGSIVFLFLIVQACFALPQPDQVSSGSADFVYPDSTTLQINASDKAIINYNSFSIAENESVIVNLPSSNSQILNRDLGGSASQIFGKLFCNGILFLINKSGIHFGPKANVDVAGIVASTRDISDSDFLSSKYIFSKQSEGDGLLLNQGKISIRNGGFGVFIAGAIENQGIIVAPIGTVAMAAGDLVRLDLSADGLISVGIDKATASTILDAEGKPITEQIKNTGTIEAGIVILKAEALPGVFETAINLDGFVKAEKIVIQGDKVVVTGNIQASQSISVTAKDLKLTSFAPLTEIYKPGNIRLTSSILNDGLIRLQGEGIDVTYLKANNLTLKTDNDINVTPGVIIQANKLKVIANKFGTVNVPLVLDANLTYISRTAGDINILESFGIGSSIMLRGPPDGFGAIIYNKEANLTLEAQEGSIYTAPGVSILANNLTLNALRGDVVLDAGSIIDVSASATKAVGSVFISANRVGLLGTILANSNNETKGLVIISSLGKTVLMPTCLIQARGGDVRINPPGAQGFTGSRANSSTIMYSGATIDTMGGLDDGFVEISGASINVDYGTIKAGRMLFDPLNITFTNGADANVTGFNPPGDLTEAFADDAGLTSNFRVDGVAGILRNVPASSTITFQATNNITVSNAFNLNTATTQNNVSLVLQANNDITVNAAITATGSGTISLSANNNVNLNAIVTASGTGTISITADADASGAGNIVIAAAGGVVTANQSITLTAVTLNITTPGATINSGSGTITIKPSRSSTVGLGAGAGTLSLTDAEFDAFTTSGTLTIGDSNATTMTVDQLTLPATVTGTLALVANGAAGSITFSGAASTTTAGLSLTALAGVTIAHNVTTNGAVTINADSNGDGTGNFNMPNNPRRLISTNNPVTITANDIVINTGGAAANITCGTASLTILVSDGGTIGLGATAGGMQITSGELRQMSATGFTLGDSTNGNITVNGIAAADSQNITGTITLNATGAANTVTFATGASTFNALAVNAGAGINVNIGVTTDTGGFTANADSDSSGGGTFAVANTRTVSTAGVNQPINITAADIILTGSGTLASGSGNVTLKPSTAAATIGIEDAAKNFSLTNAELTNITTTGLITVGVSTNTGGITIGTDAAVNQGAKNFSFITGGSIAIGANNFTTTGNVTLSADADTTGTGSITTGAGIIAANTLTASAAQGITLNTNVTTLSATNTTSGNVTITETNAVSVSGSNTGGGSFNVTAGGAGNVLTVNAGNIASNGGNITLTADDMTITGTVNGGAGIVTLKQNTAARNIDLGTNTVGTLGLTDAELDQVTASVLRIGSAAAGNINVSAAITAPAGYSTLSLLAGGTVGQAASLTVTNLAVQSTGAVALVNVNNNVTTVAGTTSNANFSYTDLNALTVGTVDGVTGITTAGGSVNLVTGAGAGSTLTVNQAVNSSGGAGNGNITCNAGGAITIGANLTAGAVGGTVTLNPTTGGATQNAGSITGQNLLLLGVGTFTLNQATNNVVNIAANVTGAVTYKDANALTITTVGATNGITTNNNAIDISTVNGTLTVNDTAAATDVNAGSSTVTLTAGSSGNDNVLTINSSASVSGTGGVTLVADNMSIGATANVSAGAAIATLRPYENGTLIDLGGADAAGTLGLTDAELDRVTAGILRVGNANSGNISVSAAITPAGTNTLSLQTGGTVLQTSSLTVTNLAVQSIGATTLTNASNNISNLAANVSGQTNSFTYRDNNSFTVGTVDGVIGINTANVTTTGVTSGSVTLTSDTGAITVTNNIKTGDASSAFSVNFVTNASGNISLTSATGINGIGRLITGNAAFTGMMMGGGCVALSGSINANVTGAGDIGLSGADALTIGSATEVIGVGTATAGNITLSADRVNNGTVGNPLDVSFGTAGGGFTNNAGILTITTDGAVGPAGEIQITSGEALSLGALVTAGASAQTINISTTGTANLTVTNAAESISGDAVSLTTATGTLEIKDTSFDVGAGSLTLTTDGTLTLSGGANSIKGTGGTILIQPVTTSNSIGVAGAAGTLQVTTTDIAALQDGFNSITIGRSNGTGLVTVNAVTFNDPVLIRSPSGAGSVIVSGQITGSGNASVSITPGSGGINLNNNIITSGNAVALNGNVVLGASATIDTEQGSVGNGGTVTISGTVSGNAAGRDLSIDTSTGFGGGNGGNVSLQAFGNAGGGYINDLSITTTPGAGGTAGSITLGGNISLDGAAGDWGDFTVIGGGNIILGNSITIDTANSGTTYTGGNVDFSTSAVSGNAAGRDLTIDVRRGGSVWPCGDGTINLGSFSNQGGFYIHDLTLYAALGGATGNDGGINFYGNIFLDDDGAGNPSSLIVATVPGHSPRMYLYNSVIFDSEQGNTPGVNAGALNFGIQAGSGLYAAATGYDLTFDTSTTGAGSNGGAVTLGGVSVMLGGSRVNDVLIDTSSSTGTPGQITITGSGFALGANGLDLASFRVVGGGNIILSYASSVAIDTENENDAIASSGGPVDLGTSSVSSTLAGGSLSINTGTFDAGLNAGDISIAGFNNTGGFYLSWLQVTKNPGSGGTAGNLTLNGNISLDDNGAGTASTFKVIGGGDIIISDNITIDTEQGNTPGVNGGVVDFGPSQLFWGSWINYNACNVYADASGYTLNINTATTAAGRTGGAVTLGLVDDNAGANNYLTSLVINTQAATNGAISLQAVTTAGNQDYTGNITLNGNLKTDVVASAGSINLTGPVTLGNNISIDTNAATADGNVTFSSTLDGAFNLTIDAGDANINFNGIAGGSSRPFNLSTTGNVNLAAALNLGNNLTHNSGTWTSGANAIDANGGFSVAAGATFNAPSSTLTVGGNFNVAAGATFNNNSGTVILDGAMMPQGLTCSQSFNNLIINKTNPTDRAVLGSALDVNGDLTITNSILDVSAASNYPINLAGNWINNGGFVERSGTVTLDGTNQSISGSTPTTFYNLTKTTAAACTLTIQANSTLTISNTLDLQGASGQLLSLRSSTPSTRYTFNITSGVDQVVSYLDVQDSNASGRDINASYTTNSGNNDDAEAAPHWVFAAGGLRFWVGSTDWDNNANWSNRSGGPGGFSFPVAGDRAIFDGGGTGNCTLDVAVNVGTIEFKGAADPKGAYTGTFNANGQTLTASGLVTLSGGTYQASTNTQTFNGGLTISGGTFTGSSGTVDLNGVLTLSSGTLTAPSGNFNISGNVNISGGTFPPGSNTVTLDGGTAQSLTSNQSFNNLTLNKAINTDTVTLGSALDINGNLTITTGTLDVSASNYAITVAGNWSNSGNFTARSGTVTFDTTGASTISGNTTFNNFTCTTATKTLSFASGSTQNIDGVLTLTGASGNLITLSRSGGSGLNQWNIIVNSSTGSFSVSYVDVSNSNASGGKTIAATNSNDGGNNTNWSFISKIVFTTSPQTLTAGVVSGVMTIQTQDSSSNPVNVSSNTTINLTTDSTGGKFYSDSGGVTEITSVTINSGTNSASFYYKDTKSGSPQITAAESPSQGWTDATQTETINPAAAATLSVSGFPTPRTAGVAGNVTVTALDAYGNTATGYLGTVTFSSNDAQAVLPINYTFTGPDAGTRVFSVELRTAGSGRTITATDTVTGTITGTQSGIQINPAGAATLSVSGFPSPQTAGVAANVTVTALDAYGNTATGYVGTVTFSSNDAQAVLPINYTFTGPDAGTRVFSVELRTAGSGRTITATDTVTGTITGTQSGIVINPAATSVFTVAGFPSPQTAGVAGNVTVTAKDAYGNTTPGYLGTVTFSSNDPQAVLPINYTFTGPDAGSRVFSVTLKTAGTGRTITATDTVTGTITGTQSGIQINPAAASVLIITTQPSGATVGSAFLIQPVIISQDAFGNNSTVGLGASEIVTATINTGTGPLQGTVALDIGTAAGNGTISYTDLRIDVVQTGLILNFASPSLAGINSNPFNVSSSGPSFDINAIIDKSVRETYVMFKDLYPLDLRFFGYAGKPEVFIPRGTDLVIPPNFSPAQFYSGSFFR